ncbi:glycoside hydrolase family 43 [Gemmatirosa kalamazoonensis]|uniref:Glycoside hydrolase family 43 n=1 Tax=Gemmatirosa kalamazoonensis TaxID=861299 RepID=W0RNS4_9BACT|nr:glycoside hydrolase family 43 protein [Gemmatirosa kalamazoonensis]AHG91995.1 glycoside hydrolase family 43 [Gemmatirosa kalamazoonensis]
MRYAMTMLPALRALRALPALALLACGGGGGGAGGGVVTPPPPVTPTAQQYVNPVLDVDFPDPAVTKSSDGFYYAYATQTTGLRIQVARSRDLVQWTTLGEALPNRPSWASESQNFWAPDVNEREGRFVMYYSAQIDASKRTNPSDGFCVGMATATTAAGPFTDVGHPVVCGPTFTTIDPMGFDDPQSGKRYLYWGSAGAPIVVQELAADRASFTAGSTPVSLVSPRAGNDPSAYDVGLIEGPWVTFHAPNYYLFFSGNACCGAAAHYAVMVARATSPTGPYDVLRNGAAAQPVLTGAGTWTAPGHNAVITDAAGVDWMLYHAINTANPFLIPGRTDISRRPMLLDRITWTNGWPVVGTAGNPTATPQTRPTP